MPSYIMNLMGKMGSMAMQVQGHGYSGRLLRRRQPESLHSERI
jgi:hypothetical protein